MDTLQTTVRRKSFILGGEIRKEISFKGSSLSISKISLWLLGGESVRSHKPGKGRHCFAGNEGLDGDEWQGETRDSGFYMLLERADSGCC